MEKNNRILVVDDEKINLENIGHVLIQEGYEVTTADSGHSAVEKIEQEHFDLVITDLKMADVDGIQVMETTKNRLPDAEVIMITGYATVTQAVEVMANGAFYFLSKPIKLNELLSLVEKALEKNTLKNEILRLKQQIEGKNGASQLIGRNPVMVKLKNTIVQIAQLHSNVIITGETGTGKELVARLIHELGPRAQMRFLPINCAALNEELILNELFGHEKQSISGTGRSRQGLLESADGGIVLLDEIGEMPLTAQVKILRVLQEKKIIRVGGTREIAVDIRILATTNLDLDREIKAGRFRKDLYYRLNVISLHIPPLRERRDDIALLTRHFLAKYPGTDGKLRSISPEALQLLRQYDYPGNVRELENIIEYAVAVCDGATITKALLPSEVKEPPSEMSGVDSFHRQKRNLEENEREHILAVLNSVAGNKTKAAKLLGIDRVSLWRKLKKFEGV
jgi:DNA-binding NtrC family response regulator